MHRLNCKLFMSMFLFCVLHTIKTFSQSVSKIYADPETAPGIKASKFIDSISFIPLETTKYSKFSNNEQFILTKDYYATFDYDSKEIFFFDKSGKFIYKFGNKLKRFVIEDIQYVPSKNALLIRSKNKNYTITDKKTLQLIERWKGKDISKYISLQWLYLDNGFKTENIYAPSYALNNIIYFDGNYLVKNSSYNKYIKDSILYKLVQYDANGNIKHRYFPYLNLPNLWQSYSNFSIPVCSTVSDSMFLVQTDFYNTIYELHPDTLIEKYNFIFPMANVMSSDFSSLSFRNNIDFEKYKEKNAKAISSFYNIKEQGNYLFFSTRSLQYDINNYLLFHNTVYNLNELITDSCIYNLPPNIFANFPNQDHAYMYTMMDAATLLQQKDNLLANKNLPQTFKDYLSKMTKDDNNIVIQIKLK